MRYLGSLASGASFEDDVGRGPPLLCSLALASEASASARKEGDWLGGAEPEGRARLGRAADRHHGTALVKPPALAPHPQPTWDPSC